MPRSDELDGARRYLLRLLRYRPRSRAEAESRLRQRGYPDEVIKEILVWAESSGLIDDEAFAKLWITNRLQHRPSGIALLRHELRRKGIALELIERVLRGARVDEEALVRELAVERLERYRGLSPEEQRRRTLAFLTRRGFPPGLSRKVLQELLD
jgi:regulatory protein